MAARQKGVNPEIRRFWRLLEPNISFEAVWHELNSHPGRVASSTIDALIFSPRKGIGALGNPDTLQRLSQLNDAQLRDVVIRLQKFRPQIAPAWTPEQVEILVAVRKKLK